MHISLQALSNFVRRVKNARDLEHRVVADMVLVAYWGLARIGELVQDPDNATWFIKKRDVEVRSTKAVITLWDAKTAAAGEPQFLNLSHQPNHLDPLEPVRRLAKGKGSAPLFAMACGKPVTRTFFETVLKKYRRKDMMGVSGHSFRIGGALLLFNFGGKPKDIKVAGRWSSTAYKSYCRTFSTEEVQHTKACAAALKRRT